MGGSTSERITSLSIASNSIRDADRDNTTTGVQHLSPTHPVREEGFRISPGARHGMFSACEIERRPRGASRINPLLHLLQRAMA